MSLREGDCMEVLATLDEASVDAVVTDPPYHMVSVHRRFGKDGAAEPAEGVYRRAAAGFMGQTWDGGDLSFRPETWLAMFRVLKPGAYLLAMGATRGWHRTACAIEDAGFEVRDCLAWLYGSGFPKSHNGAWGGTALKPAWEPVVVARKPLDGTHAANHERWGTGGIDVDAMRVPLDGDTVPEFAYAEGFDPKPGRTAEQVAKQGWSSRQVGRRGGETKAKNVRYTDRPQSDGWGTRRCETEQSDEGRWPANVAHDGSEAVLGEFPHTLNPFGVDGVMHQSPGGRSPMFGEDKRTEGMRIGDEGNAARYFYTAKPSRTEKEAGLAGLPTRTLCEMNNRSEGDVGCYQKASPEIRACTHPTVKPIELFRWLIRGFVPRGGLVLDPFAGSGTTAIAAVLEGRRWIAIEREREYAEIARARIEWWTREAARKPGRSVAEILGEVALPKRQAKDGPVQGALL